MVQIHRRYEAYRECLISTSEIEGRDIKESSSSVFSNILSFEELNSFYLTSYKNYAIIIVEKKNGHYNTGTGKVIYSTYTISR